MTWLLYPTERALEDATDLRDVQPVRLYRIGFPLHVVEISATVAAGEPFELLDRFVGLAIANAGLQSVTDIAAFLGITEPMVDRVLRFLSSIGHVSGTDGTLKLMPLGLRSVRDNQRYTETEDRLKLYFDGVRCDPMPKAYYGRQVRVLDRAQACADDQRFRLVQHACGYRPAALDELASRANRADFNLPDEHRDLRALDTDEAYLPCYVVRTRTTVGLQTLVYSGARDTPDDHLGRIIADWRSLEQQLTLEDRDDGRELYTRWLRERGLTADSLRWTNDESVRLVLPASRYPLEAPLNRGKGDFPLYQVGSYRVIGSRILQLWCDDARTRRRAALERAHAYSGSTRRTSAEIAALLDRLGRRLELNPAPNLDDLRAHAHDTGQTLARLDTSGP